MFINNPQWQSSGIVIFLCKYDTVISDTLVGFLLDVLFLLLQHYHSFMRNEEGIKIELQKKVHRRICVRDITFLTARLPFYIISCCLIRLLPSQETYLLNGPNKDTYCYGWYSVWCQKYENILQFNTILTNLFLVTAVAQFTAKTTNSIIKSCSIIKLKYHMLFTSKNFMFFYFSWKNGEKW